MESLQKQVLLNPSYLERVPAGDILKLCYTSKTFYERCQTDESIAYVFVKQLKNGLQYFVNVVDGLTDFGDKNIEIFIIDPKNRDAVLASVEFSLKNFDETSETYIDRILETQRTRNKYLKIFSYLVKVEGNQLSFIKETSSITFTVKLPLDMFIKILELAKTDTTDKNIYIYEDGTILSLGAYEITDLFKNNKMVEKYSNIYIQ
jgi:hypothetical protein